MNEISPLTSALAGIEKDLALLMLSHQKALHEAEAREASRQPQGAEKTEFEGGEFGHAREAITRQTANSSAELIARQQGLQIEAREAGPTFIPVVIPPDGQGITAQKLRRLAYLCTVVGEADRTEWESMLAQELKPPLFTSPKTVEKAAAVIELAAFLQSTAFDRTSVYRLTSRRRLAVSKLEDAILINQAPDDLRRLSSAAMITLSEAEADAALRQRDEGSDARFEARYRPFHSNWGKFNQSLDDRREERLTKDRGCLMPWAEEAIRAEVAGIRGLAVAAITDPEARAQLVSRAGGSESVISVAVAASEQRGVSGIASDDELEGRDRVAAFADEGVDEIRREEDQRSDRASDQDRSTEPKRSLGSKH